jgi:DNA replication protein DnaC
LRAVPDAREQKVQAQLRSEALERRRQREAEARAELDARLCKPEHQTLKAAALSAKTLCAVLMGPTGVGKTTTARYLVRHCHAHWVRAIDLATAERRYGLGSGVSPEIHQARDARVLVIDDVGLERDVSVLFDVIDWRYSNGAPVIVTTGLTKDGLTKHISAAGVRRLVEQHCGSMPVLVVDCHEQRGRK